MGGAAGFGTAPPRIFFGTPNFPARDPSDFRSIGPTIFTTVNSFLFTGNNGQPAEIFPFTEHINFGRLSAVFHIDNLAPAGTLQLFSDRVHVGRRELPGSVELKNTDIDRLEPAHEILGYGLILIAFGQKPRGKPQLILIQRHVH